MADEDSKPQQPLFSSLFASVKGGKKKSRAEQKVDSAAKKVRLSQEEERRAEAERQRILISKSVKMSVLKDEPAIEDEEPILPLAKKKVIKRKSFRDLLFLAGIEVEPVIIYKKIFMAAVIFNLLLTGLTLIIGFIFDTTFQTLSGIGGYLGFIAALWTVFLAGLFVVFSLGFTVYLDLRISRRRAEIEAVFPDFLQLAAANLSAGMTVDRALWSAIRPRFGVLAKEMEDVAKKTITGMDLERALQDFSEKYDSLIIKRSVNLITEGIRSGGKMADILNKIAVNMQENSILQKEMSANVTTYVIFISFASVVAAPFLFGLATQLLIVIKSIAASIVAQGAQGGSLGISLSADVIKTSDFRLFCILVLSVTSLMSACMVSVIRKGTVRDGIRLLPFFWFVSISLYYISAWALGFMFGGLV